MATPRADENEISSTTFLIGAVVVIGLFIAVQIGRVIIAPAEDPTPEQPVVEQPIVDDDDEPEELDDEPKERPFEHESPLDGEVKYDAERKRLVVTRGEERSVVSMADIVGLEKENNGQLNLRASDGRRVSVTQEFIDELPTRVRYQFDYESSGNVDTDGKGTPLDEDGRPITSDN